MDTRAWHTPRLGLDRPYGGQVWGARSKRPQPAARSQPMNKTPTCPKYWGQWSCWTLCTDARRDTLETEDPLKALLAYRSIRFENGYSPAELLIGWRICSTIPALPEFLLPKLPDRGGLREKEAAYHDCTKANYCRHCAMPKQPLYLGTPIWIRDMEQPGIVEQALDQPRSYLVEMEKGSLRCNRSQLTGEPVVMTSAVETASPVPPEAAPCHPSRRTTKTQCLIETILKWGYIMDFPDT